MGVLAGAETTMQQESFESRARLLMRMEEQEQKAIEKAKEDEKKSNFSKFYQINEEYDEYLMALTDTQPKALHILLFIFHHMDNYNALMCSHKVFEEQFGYSPSTVKRCIKYLREHGYLYVYKSGVSNVYVANNNLVWKSYGKNAKYCKFPANIMLSMSEQEQEDDCFKKMQGRTPNRVKQNRTPTLISGSVD